jgi:hypothetical protein
MGFRKAFFHRVAGMILAPLVLASCSSVEADDLQMHGRVVEVESGRGLPGAIVVAQYQGGLTWGGGSCNRLESATTDANGDFTLPLDRNAGPLYMQAYLKGYQKVTNPRYAVGVGGGKWKVWVLDKAAPLGFREEPTIYRTEKEVVEASRQDKDVYLKRFEGTREERIMNLKVLDHIVICSAPTFSSDGGIGFLEAMRRELLDLQAGEEMLSEMDYLSEMRRSNIERWRQIR